MTAYRIACQLHFQVSTRSNEEASRAKRGALGIWDTNLVPSTESYEGGQAKPAPTERIVTLLTHEVGIDLLFELRLEDVQAVQVPAQESHRRFQDDLKPPQKKVRQEQRVIFEYLEMSCALP